MVRKLAKIPHFLGDVTHWSTQITEYLTMPSLKMQVINSIRELTKNDKEIFKNSIFVCVQHLLYTSVDLFNALIYLGAQPNNIFLLGKLYSNNQDVFNILSQKGLNLIQSLPQTKFGYFQESFENDILRLWSKVLEHLKYRNIEKVIILDDGGFCLKDAPSQILNDYPVMGIEQTSSGLVKIGKNKLAFPLIEVASSAAKQHVESPMIAKSVEEKLVDKLPLHGTRLTCGVVGLGVIGKAATEKLLNLGHTVYTYDRHSEKNIALPGAHKVNNVSEILTLSDYIFGCAGEDILKNLNIRDMIKSNKFFISCSSQDKEFRSLLLECSTIDSNDVVDPLSIAELKLSDTITLKILRGGFPINLDNTGYAVKPNDIQMTRGLLLAALIQAALLTNHRPQGIPKHIMLCPLFQNFVVNEWRPFGSSYAVDNPIINNFSNLDWIKQNSGGEAFGQAYTAHLFNKAFCVTQ